MNYQLVILDRDGVINHDSDQYIKFPEEWHPIAGSLHAIATLNQANIKVAIATNQSGIARGYYTDTDLQKIHEKMLNALKLCNGHIDHIAYCPHHPNDACSCRKPQPGLLLQISQALNIPLNRALMIGDSLKDYQVAQNAGCDFTLVRTGNGEQTVADMTHNTTPIYANLAEAITHIVHVTP
jgi:D-glycero-D-manno-heptose 1,7-bisphosphate phosphatase